MKISTIHSFNQENFVFGRRDDCPEGVSGIEVEPEDTLEQVLMGLHLLSTPVILSLPEEQRVLNDPADFAQLRTIRTPQELGFFIPDCAQTVAHIAQQYGFVCTSSFKEISQLFSPQENHVSVREYASGSWPGTQPGTQAITIEDVQEGFDISEEHDRSPTSLQPSFQQVAPRPANSQTEPDCASTKSIFLHIQRARVPLYVALLLIAGIVLLPALFSRPAGLLYSGASASTIVGQVTFSSSGQLDASNAKGLNDIVTVHLHSLPSPGAGQSDYGWLMPDRSDDTIRPLLLGRIIVTNGNVQLIYTHPDHENLLALYSGFEVTEQAGDGRPTMPALDPQALRYSGHIPDIPTPGDEQHYSLLSHMRHLLAADPALQRIGLQGGLDDWLFRNTEKILEWSSAARDNWAGGQQTALIHRHMLRILDTLDGSAYVSLSGDVPPGSPLLIDPPANRIGLLELNPNQVLPAYVTHVDLHLRGLMNAPGHSKAQRQRAIQIDHALSIDASLLQNVRRDAITLARMNETHLKNEPALSLLNDMETDANTAYTGRFDPAVGGTIDGVVWIHSELQGMATITVVEGSF